MNLKKVKIKSKKSIGVEPVYDICVPMAHHYLLDSGVVSHNSGFIYASSIVIAMKKLKLKEDDEGNKVSDVRGIKAACKVMKSRYSKPFESVKVNIPYDTGIDPYSGMFDMLLKMEILEKTGNRYKYVSPVDGTEIIQFQKAWSRNDNGCLDRVMTEFSQVKKVAAYSLADHIDTEVLEEEQE